MATNGDLDKDLETFLADERFTRTFDRPADPAKGHAEAVRISYADFGYRDQKNPDLENVFLFFGPLLASRMLFVAKDSLAKEHRVRLIVLDRPGFGETPDVRPEKRLLSCREGTAALLQHLQIRYVSLGAQSAGTIYALDFLLHYPQILHPERPYLAIGAPWVHPLHSGVWSMAIVQCLPEILLRQTDKFASFFSTVSAPVVENSFRFANNLSSWLWTQTPEEIVTNTDSRVAFAEALDPKVFEFIFARPVHGMSNEAILLMKKAQGVSGWADWGDYDTLVLRLRQILQENDRRLVIDVFFSETDSVIGNPGTAGPEWFKHCWKCDGEDGTIQFFSKVVSGTDHDSIWATRWGMARDVFMRIGDVHVS